MRWIRLAESSRPLKVCISKNLSYHHSRQCSNASSGNPKSEKYPQLLKFFLIRPIRHRFKSPSVPEDGILRQQNIKAKITRIIMDSCELPEAEVNANKKKDLKTLGVDSLMILEFVSAVKKGFPVGQ